MRVSEYYNLNRSQPSLDFVDVDIFGDIEVFIDPRALRLLKSDWGDECVSLIQDFFRTVLKAIKTGNNEKAQRLLLALREPNETHLGLSKGKARGRALGEQSSYNVYLALSRSEAAKSGLLEDLEDTVLLVEGIDRDIISDITTNIIREPLIRYTQEVCEYYKIPVEDEVDSGPLWDPREKEWYSELVSLPIADQKKLLFVPKVIVRHFLDYNADQYYRHYLLLHLQHLELRANTELVQLLKDGRRRVTKKSIVKKYGGGKKVILEQTLEHPEVLDQYRQEKRNTIRPPLNHHQIAEAEGTQPPDWEFLLSSVIDIAPGRAQSSKYENAIEQLLTPLFYPSLAHPQVQLRIHDGRKIIDITYTTIGYDGFFLWLSRHYSSAHIFVECKNYKSEVGNPELDQLSSRFSPSRGQIGLLVCRNFDNKELFFKRCKDTAQDQRGYIIPIDDDDLENLVIGRKEDDFMMEFKFLKAKFDKLIM